MGVCTADSLEIHAKIAAHKGCWQEEDSHDGEDIDGSALIFLLCLHKLDVLVCEPSRPLETFGAVHDPALHNAKDLVDVYALAFEIHLPRYAVGSVAVWIKRLLIHEQN